MAELVLFNQKKLSGVLIISQFLGILLLFKNKLKLVGKILYFRLWNSLMNKLIKLKSNLVLLKL